MTIKSTHKKPFSSSRNSLTSPMRRTECSGSANKLPIKPLSREFTMMQRMAKRCFHEQNCYPEDDWNFLDALQWSHIRTYTTKFLYCIYHTIFTKRVSSVLYNLIISYQENNFQSTYLYLITLRSINLLQAFVICTPYFETHMH